MERVFYKKVFFIYKPLYFFYKYISDAGKIKRLRKIVKPGMVVLDIGANIGFYSVFFAKLVGETGKVIAFEPEACNFSHLAESTGDFHQVEINNMAVGEKSEKIKFYHSDLYNVDGRTYDPGDDRKTTLVNGISVDDYLGDGQRVDVIKIDTQGYEYYALKGMARTLLALDRVVILGEFWPHAMKRSGIDPRLFIELLEGFGLKIEFESGQRRDEVLSKGDDSHFYTDFWAAK